MTAFKSCFEKREREGGEMTISSNLIRMKKTSIWKKFEQKQGPDSQNFLRNIRKFFCDFKMDFRHYHT